MSATAAAVAGAALIPEIEQETIKACQFVSIDLETQNASKKDRKIAAEFWKKPGNMKDPESIEDKDKKKQKEKRKAQEEKIEAKKAEYIKKLDDKAALSDFAPIGSASIWTGTEGAIFCCVKPKKKFKTIPKCPAPVFQFKTEREMLIAIRTWLDIRTSVGMVIIGTNIKRFDAPKLRLRFIHHKLIAPKCVHPRAFEAGVEMFDVMVEFLRKFTNEKSGDLFISLDEILARLYLPRHKGVISGAEVPGMFERGEVMPVLLYNFLDVVSQFNAFALMTGRINDPTQKGV